MAMIEAVKWCWRFRRFFAGGLIVLAFVWLWYAKTAVERDLAQEKLRTADLSQKVEIQNATIEEWLTAAHAREMAAQEAMRKASLDAKRHNGKAQRILIEKPVADDECVAALDLLRKYQ